MAGLIERYHANMAQSSPISMGYRVVDVGGLVQRSPYSPDRQATDDIMNGMHLTRYFFNSRRRGLCQPYCDKTFSRHKTIQVANLLKVGETYHYPALLTPSLGRGGIPNGMKRNGSFALFPACQLKVGYGQKPYP